MIIYLKFAIIFSVVTLLNNLNYVKCEIVPINYDLKLQINYNDEKLHGICKLEFSSSENEDTLPVILYRLLKVNSVTDTDGRPLNFKQQVVNFYDFEPLQVNYVQINAVSLRTVVIDYEGYLLGYTETGMNYIKDRIDPRFTIIRTDCYAYPVIGIPSLSYLRKSISNLFNYRISVSVPDSIYVVNGGGLVSKKSEGNNAILEYKNIKPSWRIDICAGKYEVLNDKSFNIYYFPEDSGGAYGLLESAVNSFQLFAFWFGNIENPGFSIIEIPDGWGSQTDVTCIIQTAAAFKNNENIDEVYHEISHLWNVKSTDIAPCRVESEGLATFLQFLVKERLNSRPGLLDSSAERIFKRLQNNFLKTPLLMDIAMIDFGKNNLTNYSYTKGMLFFYIYYKIYGEETFLKAIKNFFYKFRNTGAATDDFTNIIINITGNRSAEFLIKDWIYNTKSSELISNAKGITEIIDYYINNK